MQLLENSEWEDFMTRRVIWATLTDLHSKINNKLEVSIFLYCAQKLSNFVRLFGIFFINYTKFWLQKHGQPRKGLCALFIQETSSSSGVQSATGCKISAAKAYAPSWLLQLKLKYAGWFLTFLVNQFFLNLFSSMRIPLLWVFSIN